MDHRIFQEANVKQQQKMLPAWLQAKNLFYPQENLLKMNKNNVVTQDSDGYYMVNYNKIDIDLIKL